MANENPTEPEEAAVSTEESVPAQTAPGVQDPHARISALEAELEAVRGEGEKQREQALRAMAEADNVRKRAERDLENAHKYAIERFVGELLPVKDGLELGLAAATDSSDVESLREGTEMTLRMLSAAIEKFGVLEVSPMGEAFDPAVHQAMSTRESAEADAGTVLEVIQKGYLLNDRLVRPALVIVATRP